MEGGKKTKTGSPSSTTTGSSISNELFGPKGSNISSSTGIFDSVFSQPSAYSRSEVIGSWRKKDSENQGWNSKHKSSGNAPPQNNEGQSRSSIFQDHRVEPHSLSSSIYYGGQEVYSSTPSDSHTSGSPYTYKKDEEYDDPNGNNNLHSASRGNWWQGGLYY